MRKLVGALDSGVADVTDFFRIEQLPFLIMELIVKVDDELRMDEVKKSIPHITIVLRHKNSYFVINRQVKKVNFFLMVLIEKFQQKTLSILVWDVSYHYGRSAVDLDLREVDGK